MDNAGFQNNMVKYTDSKVQASILRKLAIYLDKQIL